MTTMVELRRQAKELQLKGYSRLDKRELEAAIYLENRKRENEKLQEIRDEPASTQPEEVSLFVPVIPVQVNPEDSFSLVDETIPGMGITNIQRMRNYQNGNGRKVPSVRQARRMRKHYRAGDTSLPLSFLVRSL